MLAAGALAAALPVSQACAETPAKPALRIPLSELGFPGYSLSMLHAGASMATVHMLDGSHLLFTYGLRSLIPRIPNDDANDSDREVGAVLLELPTGKVLARTSWRLHDHGRYLWNVGGGVFVLRSGNNLSMLTPLRAVNAGQDAFTRFALPHQPGQPVAIAGSPDGKVVTLDLETKRQATLGDPDADGEHTRRHYVIQFYRLVHGASPFDTIHIEAAGLVGSPVRLSLALDGDGYLWAEDAQRGNWMVTFNEFGGKQQKLAPVLSACRPRLSLLSRSEFLAQACRGADQQPTLVSFGFDGHENWEEPLGESLEPPTLSLAPAAGRFALSRLVAAANQSPINGMGSTDSLAQEIRVYQTESGDVLLHVICTPVIRSAENFDLSPDGSTLAVLSAQTIDLYHLPELSARDRKDLAEVQAMTPPEGNGPVLLSRITRPVNAPETVQPPETAALPRVPRSAPLPAAADTTYIRSTVAATGEVGDGGNPTPRPRPTLLNPGEQAEFKEKKTTPQ